MVPLSDKPCVIVAFSLGGLIARQLAIDLNNVKGVLFIASPLRGDGRIDLKVKKDLTPIFMGVTPFIDQNNAVHDYIDHFYSHFEPSAVAKDVF